MLFLSIDFGTSAVKLSIVDETGFTHGWAKENYPDIADWAAWETGASTELSITLRLYFDFASQKYYEFTYSPLKDATLGHVKDQLVIAP